MAPAHSKLVSRTASDSRGLSNGAGRMLVKVCASGFLLYSDSFPPADSGVGLFVHAHALAHEKNRRVMTLRSSPHWMSSCTSCSAEEEVAQVSCAKLAEDIGIFTTSTEGIFTTSSTAWSKDVCSSSGQVLDIQLPKTVSK